MKRGPKEKPKTAVRPGPMPEPPEFVESDEALRIWHQYGPLLNRLGLLESLDAIAFGMLCDAVAAYRQARDELDTTQLVISVGEGGALQQHPLVAIVRQQSKAVREFLSEFGMTPGSRSSLTGSTSATPGEQEKDPLQALAEKFGTPMPAAPTAAATQPMTPAKRIRTAKKQAAKKVAKKRRSKRQAAE